MPGKSFLSSRWLAWAVIFAAVCAVGWQLVDPLRRSDLMVFLRAAHDVASGRNPYTPVEDPYLWHGSAYVYPYLTAYLFVPLTWLPVPVADVVWFTISAAAVVLGCRALKLRDPYGVLAILMSATCIRGLQVGAINALLFLGLALMWRYRHRTLALAASFTLVAGAKLFLLPMALWLTVSRRPRAVLVAGLALSTYLGLGLLLEPISPRDFYDSMSVLAQHEGPASMSVLRWASALMPYGMAKLVPPVLGLAVVATTLAWCRRRPNVRSRAVFAACVVASLLATPIYWSHYTLLVAVPVLLASPTRRAAVAFCACSWLMSRPVMDWHGWQIPMGSRLTLLYVVMALALAGIFAAPETGGSRVRTRRRLEREGAAIAQ